jgi:cytochrome b subunit of formate dehydrogenase
VTKRKDGKRPQRPAAAKWSNSGCSNVYEQGVTDPRGDPYDPTMQTLLFVPRLILFVLGLITGLVIPARKNARMGLASHLQGMTNGPFLIVVGLL